MNGPNSEKSDPPDPSKKSLRILYADDLPELRNVARLSLTRDGHSIACVADGSLALEQITGNPAAFDVLITDHHMPKMNGMELVMRVRSLPYPGKIMVFSSELSREITSAYCELKVDRILYKPVFPSVLRQVLAELYTSPPTSAVKSEEQTAATD